MTENRPELVSLEMALALRDVGFPQEMHVGDWGVHPMALKKIVLCTFARKRDKNVQSAEPRILRMPTVDEAQQFCGKRGLFISVGTS